MDKFTQIDQGEWTKMIKNMVNIDVSRLKDIKFNYEIRKTYTNGNLLDYIILWYHPESKPLLIYEFQDEYLGVYCDMSSKVKIRCKCDQIDGLIECIDYISYNF